MRVITSQVVKDEGVIITCIVVCHFVIVDVKLTLANPAVCCIIELVPIFICEDHLLSKIQFLMSIFEVHLEHFNEHLNNIFTFVVSPIDDWL